jgi:hypothetical protein
VERALALTSDLDPKLHSLLEAFNQARDQTHDIRHKFVHALWGYGETETAVARDIRREETLKPGDLDSAMIEMARLARAAHACAYRAAELIIEGRLREGQSRKPAMFINDRWVNL